MIRSGEMSELKRTPIYSEYEKNGARTIDFGGWDLPVQFSGIKHEHEVTRTKAGLFDVSHMGEIIVRGKSSEQYLQKMVTNDISKLEVQRAQYTFMCYENGGTVDDFLVYKLDQDHYMLVVNAANIEKDFEWLQKHNTYGEDVIVENVSDSYALLALQGPQAETVLQKVVGTDLSEIKMFRFLDNVEIANIQAKALISRTGYTGEDGFEIYITADKGASLWNLLLTSGQDEGIEPIGLGARDTLRFEVGLPLYGQELTKDITPLEAGLAFAVKVDKGVDFLGSDVLKEQKNQGTNRTLVGIEMIDKGIPRTDYDVLVNDEKVGFVTSGTQSPTLKKNLGIALIDRKHSDIGTEVVVQVRKRQLKAQVIATPFYKRNN